MTLRRYAQMKPSKGTVIPLSLRVAVKFRDMKARDEWPVCVGPIVGMPGDCAGQSEIDHVRASGGIGMKSPTELGNLVSLCSTHHREKTENGRKWRPKLLAYLEREGVTP